MPVNFSGINERINARLSQLKITQADLCRLTSISTNAMSQYVTGKRIPNTPLLFTIATALKVSMEWLLTGQEDATNENTSDESITVCDGVPLTENETDLIAMYRLVDEPDQKTIFDLTKMKYEQKIGEKESIYSTYFDEKRPRKSGPAGDAETAHEIA